MRLIAPPDRAYRRARHWSTFERLFEPFVREDGSLLWHAGEMSFPVDDPRHWWTVVEGDTGGLYIVAGFHVVNRLGFVRCLHRWGGDWSAHPAYHY